MRIALLLFLWPLTASAFPEFVRHGYTNCVSCHLSPTGGGILNEYGRVIAKEVLSNGRFFWESRMNPPEAVKAEEAQLDNPTPPGLSVGGDARALQMLVDNRQETKAQFIFMQADLEAALSDGKRLTVDGTIGRAEPAANDSRSKLGDWLVSRRHWLSLKLGPDDAVDMVQARVGRFFPAYGINIAEHTNPTRSLLGFDQQQETYNAELSYLTENWNATATYDFGRPDSPGVNNENGAYLQVSRALGSTYRVGINGFYGYNPDHVATGTSRRMAGVFGLLGFSPQWYALTDLDLTYTQLNRTGLAEFFRLGWEFIQGVHLVAEQNTGKVALQSPKVYSESYSIGLNYFPRVHWEFDLNAALARNTAQSRDFNNVFLFLGHLYL